MGMFDSLYKGERGTYGPDWQTKAFDCNLDAYWVGDRVPTIIDAYPTSYQVEIMGDGPDHTFVDSLATILDGVLVDIDNERARTLPLISYGGHLIEDGAA